MKKPLRLALTILMVPALFSPAAALAQEPVPCEFEYTVQAGDWLSKIAEKYYGDLLAYPAIVSVNNADSGDAYTDIVDPNLIEPGWTLCVPSGEDMAALLAGGDRAAGAAGTEPELVGPVWGWEQTQMSNDDLLQPDNPANYTLQFMADGAVAIQADCNQVSGTYTLDGSALSIALGPSTLAACPEGSLGDQFVANLGAAALYFVEDGQLYIDLMADGGTMRFSPLSSDLAGTSWIVANYNNGRGGVVSPLIGTELTVTFGPDGNLTGSAGCNNYSVSYQLEGENLTFGPSLGTLKECAEPEGIMAQEGEFLTALSTVATYSFKGDELLLRAADGSLAVVLIQ